MAEYKNGVNSFGNMSVDSNDVNADVHTGRVVFVDTDKYEADAAYKAKIDKCVEDGFFRSDEFGSGGAANAGSALIVQYNTQNRTLDKTVQEIYDAISAGTPVLCVYMYGDPADSSSVSYMGDIQLANFMQVYRYADNTFRVCGYRLFGDYGAMRPQVVMFGASSMSAYPSFLRNVTVKSTLVE